MQIYEHPLERMHSNIHFYDDKLYSAIMQPSHVYDGDTIQNVCVHIYEMNTAVERGVIKEIWPEVHIRYDGVWFNFNVRVNGIDTPEMHPRKHWPDGSVRSEESRLHEHQLSMKARDELIRILEEHNNVAYVRNPQIGKYAGRLVTEVVFKEDDGTLFNYAEHMISLGFAHPYGGGTKPPWHLDAPHPSGCASASEEKQ